MQVQVNPQVAARNIAEFIKSRGGEARHTEVLELMAHVCGFTTYKALRAASQAQADKKASSPATALVKTKDMLETPMNVVHRQSLAEWKVNEKTGDEKVIPGTEFEVVVEGFETCLRLMVKRVGVDMSNFAGTPFLDIMLEINNGVPCAHLSNEPNALLMSAFASNAGMYFRPDEVDSQEARDATGKMAKLVRRTCEDGTGFIMAHDTGAKYGESKAVKAAQDCGPACAECGGSSRKRTNLSGDAFLCDSCGDVRQAPCLEKIKDLGLRGGDFVLEVSQPLSSTNPDVSTSRGIQVHLFMGQGTWQDFLHIQVSRCMIDGFGEERTVTPDADVTTGYSCYTAVSSSITVEDARLLAKDVARVAAYFDLAGCSPSYIKPVLWHIVEDAEAAKVAKKVLAIAQKHASRLECYEELVAEYGLPKDPLSVD